MSATVCRECGARLDGSGSCKKCGAPVQSPTIEDQGFSIRPAERGGGLLAFRGEEAIAEVKDSSASRNELAAKMGVDRALLDAAILKAKSTPRRREEKENPEPQTYEILSTPLARLAPDSGIIEGRHYIGVWLPCKVKDPTTGFESIKQRFHLLFSDGELISGDEATLNSRHLYLTLDPIYMPLKVSLRWVLNYRNLPPIEPLTIFTKIKTEIQKYIEFDDDRYYTFLTIWIVGTYLYRRFGAYPYIQLNALKRSGKTKLLTILNLLAYNSVFSTNMSSASLYRLIQNMGSSIMIDETEKLSDPDRETDFRSMLLGGYKRGAVVYRAEKGENDKLVPTPFEVYGPKALANIRGLENVLEDRCILTILKRGIKHAIINREIPLEASIWEELRQDLTQLALTRGDQIVAEYDELGSSVYGDSSVYGVISGHPNPNRVDISGRDWELWKPLIAISMYLTQLSTPEITLQTPQTLQTPLQQIMSLAETLTNERNLENASESAEVLLIQAALKVVNKDGHYPTKRLLEAMGALYDEGAPDWVNAKWLGRALTRLGFREKRRVSGRVEYHLTPEGIKDMAGRLGVEVQSDDPNLEETIKQVIEVVRNLSPEVPIHKSKVWEGCKDLKISPDQLDRVLGLADSENVLIHLEGDFWRLP
jgi:hypothetical protein